MLAEGQGVVSVEITDVLEARDIEAHWNAVWRYLRTGDSSELWLLEGAGVGMPRFETDPKEIDAWVLTLAIRAAGSHE